MPDMLHEVAIGASPERVYAAITTQEGLRNWWTADAEAAPQVGSVAVFGFYCRATIFRMRIDELSPGRRIAWSCLGNPAEWNGTRLSFELEPADDGATRLRFTHANWRSTEGMFALCNSTWGALMHRLKQYAEGGSPGPHFRE